MERTQTIGDVEVDIEIFTEPFACDVAQCKGACCTIPDCYGAPLDEGEYEQIQRLLPTVLPLLSESAQATIAQSGFAERAPAGEWTTMTVNGRECVFAIIEDGIASCAFHRLWEAGMSDFPKPMSCHLFPIRRRSDTGALYYERYAECSTARTHGRQLGQSVYEAVRPALQRAYGDGWLVEADAASMSITRSEELWRS
jgi:hypothetical protein